MKFVDAHIHLSDEEYVGCVGEVLVEAKSLDVAAVVSNSIDLKTSLGSLALARQYPGTVFAALGVHPWTVKTLKEEELHQVSDLLLAQKGNEGLVAVGEIGLDPKYVTAWEEQMQVFDSMLRLAEKLDLPVIIHSRGATTQIVDLLPSYNLKKVLLHWFSNPISALAKVMERGYYISEGPAVTCLDGIRDVVKRVPMTNLLSETDGPVRFSGAPFKGKRTTSAFISNVIEAFANIKKIGVEEVAENVLTNFQEFFGVNVEGCGFAGEVSCGRRENV